MSIYLYMYTSCDDVFILGEEEEGEQYLVPQEAYQEEELVAVQGEGEGLACWEGAQEGECLQAA